MPIFRSLLIRFIGPVLLGAALTGSAAAARPHQPEIRAPAAQRNAPSTARRPTPLALVASYFDALDRPGRAGHNGHVLDRLYAPTITVLESLTTGYPRLHIGLLQARVFDRYNVLSWFVDRSQQLSPSVVLTIEQPYARGPGHELGRAPAWLTLFTIKSGKIVNLIWTSC